MTADAALQVERLRRRADFVRAASGIRAHCALMTLQARPRPDGEADSPPRLGFTVTRKTGGAVERNRIRRRLRAAVKLAAADMRAGHDYVIIARRGLLDAPFDRIVAELGGVIRRVHKTNGGPERPPAR